MIKLSHIVRPDSKDDSTDRFKTSKTVRSGKNVHHQLQATFSFKKAGSRTSYDTQTGMPLRIPKGARCVQRFDDSLNSAIHITYRISLRSSSMGEPRDPLSKVVFSFKSEDNGFNIL